MMLLDRGFFGEVCLQLSDSLFRILAQPKVTGINLSELNISDRRQAKSRENDLQSESTRAVTGIADTIPGHV